VMSLSGGMDLPLYPIWAIDFIGSFLMIVFSTLCLLSARDFYRRHPENVLANYLVWFFAALFAFACSRSLGHMLKYVLHFTGHTYVWMKIQPWSGAFNTATFLIMATITFFFHRMKDITDRMIQDRTRLQRTSQELLKLNRDMEVIVSERTRGELALRIAHELRNPATIIGGLVRRALKHLPVKGEEHDIMEKIFQQAQHLEGLVQEFEEVRRTEDAHFGPQELNSIVDDVVGIIQPEADAKGIVILYNRSPASLFFQGNPHLIKAALLHVVRNAIEACGYGSTVEIETKLCKDGIMVRVKDDGPGIPPIVMEHIFEPFYRSEHGETGLGLPYVQQIVHEHKGEIGIESSLGKGTTVTIRLPTHISELSRTRQ